MYVWCTLGLEGCLLQEDNHGKLRPVAYASKSLTPAETRCANIERERLAMVWHCIKFHHYLYGRKFVCQSDHKPLEDIHLKYLSDAPPRLQRLLLKLQPYDITIKYVPGSHVPVADPLSRGSLSGRTEITGLDVTKHEITHDLSHIHVETMQKTTKEDPTAQLLMQQLMEGLVRTCETGPKRPQTILAVERLFVYLNMDVSYFTVDLLGHIVSKYYTRVNN